MALTKTSNRMISGAALSVIDYGAVGNGTANDTVAFQTAINQAYALGRPLYIPAGSYRILASLVLPGAYQPTASGAGLTIFGDGDATALLHAFNGKLFTCSVTLPTFMTFRDFKIVSTSAKTAGSHAFYFGGGLAKATFSAIRVGRDGTAANSPAGLFDCLPSSTTDTIIFKDCFVEDVAHLAYGIGGGSSVWFDGGRVIGKDRVTPIGILLYGSNGGVWLYAIDAIHLAVGMKVTKDNGTSNRELFISQAAFDSCHVGLELQDNVYCEIEGIWAASCNEANILLTPAYTGVTTISGGTIFNAGVSGNNGGAWANDGLVINGGSLVKVDGVLFQHNKGTALRCPNASFPQRGTVTNCTFMNNGTAMSAGGSMEILSNQFYSNTTNLVEVGSDLRIRDNRGINPAGPMLTPAVPASGVATTYNGAYSIIVYIRSGTVAVVYLNNTAIHTGTNVTVHMSRGDQIKMDYSSAPEWVWIRN